MTAFSAVFGFDSDFFNLKILPEAHDQRRVSFYKELNREEVEDKIEFAGFVIISCPLKPDSKAVIKELVNSSHKVGPYSCDNF